MKNIVADFYELIESSSPETKLTPLSASCDLIHQRYGVGIFDDKVSSSNLHTFIQAGDFQSAKEHIDLCFPEAAQEYKEYREDQTTTGTQFEPLNPVEVEPYTPDTTRDPYRGLLRTFGDDLKESYGMTPVVTPRLREDLDIEVDDRILQIVEGEGIYILMNDEWVPYFVQDPEVQKSIRTLSWTALAFSLFALLIALLS